MKIQKETKIIFSTTLFFIIFFLFNSHLSGDHISIIRFVSYFLPLFLQPSLIFLNIGLFIFLFWFSKQLYTVCWNKEKSIFYFWDINKKNIKKNLARKNPCNIKNFSK